MREMRDLPVLPAFALGEMPQLLRQIAGRRTHLPRFINDSDHREGWTTVCTGV
jgi:hypothetical protein